MSENVGLSVDTHGVLIPDGFVGRPGIELHLLVSPRRSISIMLPSGRFCCPTGVIHTVFVVPQHTQTHKHQEEQAPARARVVEDVARIARRNRPAASGM